VGLKNFVRISLEDFNELVTEVSPFLRRQDTHLRESISVAERLSIKLRYSSFRGHVDLLFYVRKYSLEIGQYTLQIHITDKPW